MTFGSIWKIPLALLPSMASEDAPGPSMVIGGGVAQLELARGQRDRRAPFFMWNSISTGTVDASAASTAARSVPGPESAVLVTGITVDSNCRPSRARTRASPHAAACRRRGSSRRFDLAPQPPQVVLHRVARSWKVNRTTFISRCIGAASSSPEGLMPRGRERVAGEASVEDEGLGLSPQEGQFLDVPEGEARIP